MHQAHLQKVDVIVVGQYLISFIFESINVKDLCDKALINRRTFCSLDELLYELQEELSNRFFELTKDYDHISDADKIIRVYFEITNENPVFEVINNNTNLDYIRMQLNNKVGQKANNNFKSLEKYDIFTRKLIITYYNTATSNLYRQWCKDGKKLSLEHVINLATALIQNGLNGIITN